MNYLLDTNICIFTMKNNTDVIASMKRNFHKGLFVSVITLGELEFGIYNSSNIIKKRLAVSDFLSNFDIIPFDRKAASEYGLIRADLKRRGCIIGNMDMLIAAHAKSLNMTLVTNNTRDFSRVEGLIIEDWKEPA